MKLIDLLVKELPKLGGWPDGVGAVRQNCKGQLFEIYSDYCSDFKLEKCDDWITDVVTKQQYEDALEASEGWIEWNGGECPVDSDAIVEVRYRKPSPLNFNNDRAGDFSWSHDGFGGDIIAYRLRQPAKSEQVRDDAAEADEEDDLNECIGQDVDQTWNGDGLPPVGTICEAKVPRSITGWEWREVKVVESGIPGAEKEVLVYDLETTFPSWADEFRPLRTEADKKRQVAAQALCDSCGGTGKVDEGLGFGVMWFDIYDAIAAGKIPGVKLEGK